MTREHDTDMSKEKYFIGVDPATGGDDKTILTVFCAVPVPQIKVFSRWQVLKALFSRKSHFTNCNTLVTELRHENQLMLESQLKRYKL